MITIKEAHGAIEEAAMCLTSGPDCHPTAEARQDLNAAVRAGFLVAHVGACEEKELFKLPNHRLDVRSCGDGWLCDKAKEIEELGK